MKRIKEAGEKMAPPAPNTAKMSRSQYVKMTCTTCGKKGHNLRGCLKNKAVASSSKVVSNFFFHCCLSSLMRFNLHYNI